MTKYCKMHKKHDRHEGYFVHNNIRFKVKTYLIEGYFDDSDYIWTELYKFRKGRYEWVYGNDWWEYNLRVDDAVNYLVDKCIDRDYINKWRKN